jgi:hypothetical protein
MIPYIYMAVVEIPGVLSMQLVKVFDELACFAFQEIPIQYQDCFLANPV